MPYRHSLVKHLSYIVLCDDTLEVLVPTSEHKVVCLGLGEVFTKLSLVLSGLLQHGC